MGSCLYFIRSREFRKAGKGRWWNGTGDRKTTDKIMGCGRTDQLASKLVVHSLTDLLAEGGYGLSTAITGPPSWDSNG